MKITTDDWGCFFELFFLSTSHHFWVFAVEQEDDEQERSSGIIRVLKYVIAQSHGSNTVHLGVVKMSSWSLNWASEWERPVVWWDFYTQPSPGFTEHRLKKRKHPVLWVRIPCWYQRSEENDQIASSWQEGNCNLSTQNNWDLQKSISKCTEMVYSRRPRLVVLLLAKDGNLWLKFTQTNQSRMLEDFCCDI